MYISMDIEVCRRAIEQAVAAVMRDHPLENADEWRDRMIEWIVGPDIQDHEPASDQYQ